MTKNKNDVNKNVAGLLALFFGAFGVHKFYMGHRKMGQRYLRFSLGSILIVLLTLWSLYSVILLLIPVVTGIIGFAEGIIYLCSDEETFKKKYLRQHYDTMWRR